MYCQKCRTPLKLDSSLEDLNPAAYDLLVGMYAQACIITILAQTQQLTSDSHAFTTGTKEAIRPTDITYARRNKTSDI